MEQFEHIIAFIGFRKNIGVSQIWNQPKKEEHENVENKETSKKRKEN